MSKGKSNYGSGKNNANGKVRRPIVYIKRTIILVLLLSIVYFMYTKIVAHNKKEEALKAKREMKKQEELKRKKKKRNKKYRSKTKEQEEQVKQAQVAEKPAEGPLKKLMKTLNCTSIYKTQDLAGQLLL